MRTLDFLEIAKLINLTGITKVEIEPIATEKGKWAIYKATNTVPNFSYTFQILYLYSDFTKDSAFRAFQSIISTWQTQIVHAPSLKSTLVDEMRSYFRIKQPAIVQDLKTFLFSFIKDKLKGYTEKLKELKPEFFIDPPYTTPSGFKRKYPNPLISFLVEDTEDIKDGAIGILLAEPGQGKTYTTKHLASTLSSNQFIPIYIHSPQWFEMRDEDLSSIFKTITHSFRYFNSSIDWIENHEEEFLNITMNLGVFRIIFDGFDEYILWNKGRIPAEDIIKDLKALAHDSISRILVTSRTSFWNTNIISSDVQEKLFIYSIEPFDSNHANNYFKIRFPKESKSCENATNVFKNLQSLGKSEQSLSFVGRGFILSLIADLSSKDSEYSAYNTNLSIIEWLMLALCQREVKRQKLIINEVDQLKILRLFAEEKSTGTEPTTETLITIITLVCPELSNEEVNNLTGFGSFSGSLSDHPLLSKTENKWNYKHEQIEFNLIAEQIIDYAKKNNENSIIQFFSRIIVSGSFIDDIANIVYEQLEASTAPSFFPIAYTEFISTLRSVSLKSKSLSNNHDYLKVFITKIVIQFINKHYPVGHLKTERTNKFLELLSSSSFDHLQFNSSIASYDFCHTTFYQCRFENTVWANCKFDETTIFKDCCFIGGTFNYCDSVGFSSFVGTCTFDNEAESTINNERINSGKKDISIQDIKRDMELFIKKFAPREGLFKSVHSDNILSGPLSVLRYKDTLLEIMVKHILEDHKISQTKSGHGYCIRHEAKASINFFHSNGVFSGELAKAFTELCKKLKISN